MKVINKAVSLISVLVMLIATSNNCIAQQTIEESNLIKYLQQNTDSTIICYTWSMWVLYGSVTPDYLIISRINNRTVYSTYSNPFRQFAPAYNIPDGKLAVRFRMLDSLYRLTPIDTNKYFTPKYIDFNQRQAYWEQIMQYGPWQIKNDYESKWKDNEICNLKDGGYLNLLLITKKKIGYLKFYSPEYYEECSPGNINRQKAIKIEKIFEEAFK